MRQLGENLGKCIKRNWTELAYNGKVGSDLQKSLHYVLSHVRNEAKVKIYIYKYKL